MTDTSAKQESGQANQHNKGGWLPTGYRVVRHGDALGYVPTGNASGQHIHFESLEGFRSRIGTTE